MKKQISIGAMAKLAGTTTDTLRHYDKKGLLKPALVDEQTNYRYYSLTQAEHLFAILELRQLGMGIDEIRAYFEEGPDRSIDDSIELLEKQAQLLRDKIYNLTTMQKMVEEKLSYLNRAKRYRNNSAISYKFLGRRKLAIYKTPVSDTNGHFFEAIRLEGMINSIPPVFASSNYGVVMRDKDTKQLFTMVSQDYTGENAEVLEPALFICAYYYGDIISEIQKRAETLFEIARKDGYQALGATLAICRIDMAVTENQDELLYEIQIPVKKS